MGSWLDPELALLLPDDDVEPDEPLEDVCELVGEEPGAVEVVLDAAEVEAREADVVELEVEPLAEDAPAARKVSRRRAGKEMGNAPEHSDAWSSVAAPSWSGHAATMQPATAVWNTVFVQVQVRSVLRETGVRTRKTETTTTHKSGHELALSEVWRQLRRQAPMEGVAEAAEDVPVVDWAAALSATTRRARAGRMNMAASGRVTTARTKELYSERENEGNEFG